MSDMATIEAKYQALSSRLDEAALRIWAATEARSLGRGGVSLIAKAIGLSRTTIHAGLAEIKATVGSGCSDKQEQSCTDPCLRWWSKKADQFCLSFP